MELMKILFLNIYYEEFLRQHYRDNKIAHLEYMEQWVSIQEAMHSDSDFYSSAFRDLGWYAHDLITNCAPLQKQFVKEYVNGTLHEEWPIWVEQIRTQKPDVVYSQGLWLINDETYPAIKDSCKLIVGQVASHLENFGSEYYDLIFTAVPQYVEKFRDAGVDAHYMPLAFDPRVWERVKGRARSQAVTFVGNMTAGHMKRRAIVGALRDKFDVNVYEGTHFGLDMFKILAESYITINCGIDFSHPYGGNMRLFEATGCGALTLTDRIKNLPELFNDEEVLAFDDADRAIELVDHYLKHRNEGEFIAAHGQMRTHRDHTYKKRMEDALEIMEVYL